jgi:hypothetical protein
MPNLELTFDSNDNLITAKVLGSLSAQSVL